jgi:hypothetical protein
LAKAAGALGQTFAGAVLTDDLVALGVLAAEGRVDPSRLGTFGFSGGGGRSLLLAALDQRVAACVVSCMMATFASLVPTELDTHSWLLHVPGLWSLSDWPDLTALGELDFWSNTGPMTSSFRGPEWRQPMIIYSACMRAASGTAGRSRPAGTPLTPLCRKKHGPFWPKSYEAFGSNRAGPSSSG